MTANSATGQPRRRTRRVLFVTGLIVLAGLLLLLRLAWATDYLYHAVVKDPERVPPDEPAIVAPADGHVVYIRRIRDGVIPEVVKRGVPVPIADHVKVTSLRPFQDGYLIGIYMNTFGVHINRIPNRAVIKDRFIFNGPHMDMTAAETKIILRQMLPGLVTLRKLLGLTPYGIENDSDFVLQSARETLVLEDERGASIYVVRIADYYVGKLLTWVEVGQRVERGQRLGMITWGSQTDLFIEATPGLELTAEVGDYVYGGESILARYEEP